MQPNNRELRLCKLGHAYGIRSVPNRRFFREPKTIIVQVKSFSFLQVNCQPVRVWTVNFTLSFSDKASEISTCAGESIAHDGKIFTFKWI